MKIGYKLTGFFLVFTFTITGTFYLIGLYNQKKNFETVSQEHINNIEASFFNLEERDQKILLSTLEVIVQDPGIKETYLQMNRDDLHEYVQPLYQNLSSRYGITHFYFILPDGRVFLRIHNKYIHGDLVRRASFEKARDTGSSAWEIELGKTAFALRAVMPYYENDTLIGYVELGEEIDHFLKILKSETDSEFQVFADKRHLNREDWKSARQVEELRDNWDDMDEHLLLSSTMEGEEGRKCFVESNLERVEKGERILRHIKINTKTFMCGGFDLTDAHGLHIGAVVSLTDISNHVDIAQSENSMILRMAMLIFALTFTVGMLVSRSVTKPILRLADVAKAISRGDFKQRVQVTTRDEIGQTGVIFNDMIEKRKWVEDELKKATDELEIRVKNRTSQLKATNEKLQIENSQRLRIEEKLIRQNKFIRDAIESLTHPFYVIGADDYRIKMANRAANLGNITDQSTCYRLTHKRDEPCNSAEHPCPLEEVKRTRKPVMVEHIHSHADGSEGVYEIYGYPVFDSNGKVTEIIEYNLDVTERKQHEKELLRAKNLEAIGSLAAGIAHEINTPLTNASLGMQILSKKLKTMTDDSGVRKKIDSIEQSIERAALIAKELLQFSRQKESEFVLLQINESIAGALTLMDFRLGNIRIHQKLSVLPEILGDPVKLQHVFINIFNNSAEAMPDGGDLFISTSPGNGDVNIEVSDTGTGISEEHLLKVFEPFFRFKETGSGSGLGLSICYSIIKQHYGNINVSSIGGKGTTVTIQLPLKGAYE